MLYRPPLTEISMHYNRVSRARYSRESFHAFSLMTNNLFRGPGDRIMEHKDSVKRTLSQLLCRCIYILSALCLPLPPARITQRTLSRASVSAISSGIGLCNLLLLSAIALLSWSTDILNGRATTFTE